MIQKNGAIPQVEAESSDILWRSRLGVALPILAVAPALAVFISVLVASLGLRAVLADSLARQARLVVEMVTPGHEAALERRMEAALRLRQQDTQVFVRALPIAETGAVDDPMPPALQRGVMALAVGGETNTAVLEGVTANATSCGLARSVSGAAGAVVCVPSASLLASAEQLVLHGFAVLVAVAGMAFLAALIWLRRLTTPMTRCIRAMRHLSSGDASPIAPLGGREWLDLDQDIETLRQIVSRDEEREAKRSRAALDAAPHGLDRETHLSDPGK